MGSSPQSPEAQQPEPQKAEPRTPGPWTPEPGPDAAAPAADYVDGVPTFDFVRDRIEGRYATALGSTELSEESAAGRTVAQQQEDRDTKARERLEQIRRSVRGE